MIALIYVAAVEVLFVAWVLVKAQLDIDAVRGDLDTPRLRGGLAALSEDVADHPLPSYPWRGWLEPELAHVASAGPRTHSVAWADIRLRLLLERREAEQFYTLVTTNFPTGERRALTAVANGTFWRPPAQYVRSAA
jgi:hypothetical protein